MVFLASEITDAANEEDKTCFCEVLAERRCWDAKGAFAPGRSLEGIESSSRFFALNVVVAAACMSTGGLFIKWTSLSGLELSVRPLAVRGLTLQSSRGTKALPHPVTAVASVLYAALLLLLYWRPETTAANAIFLHTQHPSTFSFSNPVL